MLQGDTNSHFYHQFANGRRRKNTIFVLNTNEEEIRGQKEITSHIVNFYKQLLGHSEPCTLYLGDNFWPHNSKLTKDQQDELVRQFEKDEILKVIKELKENSAPGPNGFNSVFSKEMLGHFAGGSV